MHSIIFHFPSPAHFVFPRGGSPPRRLGKGRAPPRTGHAQNFSSRVPSTVLQTNRSVNAILREEDAHLTSLRSLKTPTLPKLSLYLPAPAQTVPTKRKPSGLGSLFEAIAFRVTTPFLRVKTPFFPHGEGCSDRSDKANAERIRIPL